MNRVLSPRQVTPAISIAVGDPVVLRGRTMGTDWCVRLCGDLPPQRWLQLDIQQTLDRLDGQMSHWSPQSDLGVFNRRVRIGGCDRSDASLPLDVPRSGVRHPEDLQRAARGVATRLAEPPPG